MGGRCVSPSVKNAPGNSTAAVNDALVPMTEDSTIRVVQIRVGRRQNGLRE